MSKEPDYREAAEDYVDHLYGETARDVQRDFAIADFTEGASHAHSLLSPRIEELEKRLIESEILTLQGKIDELEKENERLREGLKDCKLAIENDPDGETAEAVRIIDKALSSLTNIEEGK